jgi:hypothetical protein
MKHKGRFAAISFATYGPQGLVAKESLPQRRG